MVHNASYMKHYKPFRPQWVTHRMGKRPAKKSKSTISSGTKSFKPCYHVCYCSFKYHFLGLAYILKGCENVKEIHLKRLRKYQGDNFERRRDFATQNFPCLITFSQGSHLKFSSTICLAVFQKNESTNPCYGYFQHPFRT